MITKWCLKHLLLCRPMGSSVLRVARLMEVQLLMSRVAYLTLDVSITATRTSTWRSSFTEQMLPLNSLLKITGAISIPLPSDGLYHRKAFFVQGLLTS